MSNTALEALEDAKHNYKVHHEELSRLKRTLYSLESKTHEVFKNLYDSWMDSRPRVKLKTDSKISWLVTTHIYRYFSILKGDLLKIEFGHDFILDRRWTKPEKVFKHWKTGNPCQRFDPVLVPAGKEFTVLRTIKQKVEISKDLFEEQPSTGSAPHIGAYSLVVFPWAEATKEYIDQTKDDAIVNRFDWNEQYSIKNGNITHVFMIIPNQFLEAV